MPAVAGGSLENQALASLAVTPPSLASNATSPGKKKGGKRKKGKKGVESKCVTDTKVRNTLDQLVPFQNHSQCPEKLSLSAFHRMWSQYRTSCRRANNYNGALHTLLLHMVLLNRMTMTFLGRWSYS